MALSLITKAVDTMSIWVDKINASFAQVDTNEAGVATNAAGVATNVTAIGLNTTGVATNVTAIGLNTTASGNNTTKNTTQDGRLDVLETVPATSTPVTSDTFVFIEVSSGDKKTGLIRDIVSAGQVNAIASGSISSAFATSATHAAIPAFGTSFSSSTPAITQTAGGLGLTLAIPVKFRISITASMAAGTGKEFFFQIYVNSVAVGRVTTVTGDGSAKYMNFAAQGISTTTSIGNTIELEVWSDAADSIDLFDSDMDIMFAGL